jgi:glycerophosphoryl diester phosphodiesterase
MHLAKYIAHAGGQIKGLKYTNSLESFNHAKERGYKFIELDISKTLDGKYVLIHDFHKTRNNLFGKEGEVSFAEFMQDKMKQNLTKQSLKDALIWLENNPEIFFVSDTKNCDLIEVLKYIKTNYPNLRERFIPQIFQIEQIEQAKSLGFNTQIFAFYHIEINPENIEKINQRTFLAVSFSKNKITKDLCSSISNKVLVHTVNDLEEQKQLEGKGIDCFFTDILLS